MSSMLTAAAPRSDNCSAAASALARLRAASARS